MGEMLYIENSITIIKSLDALPIDSYDICHTHTFSYLHMLIRVLFIYDIYKLYTSDHSYNLLSWANEMYGDSFYLLFAIKTQTGKLQLNFREIAGFTPNSPLQQVMAVFHKMSPR